MGPFENILAPSILAGNHADLIFSLDEISEAKAKWVHLDIMDGHFVPNITFGPQTVADLRKYNNEIFFDVHLMLSEPQKYVEAFAKAGADLITIHVEPNYAIENTLNQIKELGCQCGIALNPDIAAETIEPYISNVDLVLAMTVFPGFGGQSFHHEVLSKLSLISKWREERELNFRLEVDGGIGLETSQLCKEKGVDTFVAGTAFFKADNRNDFREQIES